MWPFNLSLLLCCFCFVLFCFVLFCFVLFLFVCLFLELYNLPFDSHIRAHTLININFNSAPITPTPKRSWFKNLFRRRPSVEISKPQQGASGMYSAKDPEQLKQDVQRILNELGISLKSNPSDSEMKCECLCYLDPTYQIVVTDKNGQEVKFRGQEAKSGETKDSEVSATAAAAQEPPKSPKPQLVKFSIDISRGANEKVSCINFNHKSGDQLVYRGLYTEVIKRLIL